MAVDNTTNNVPFVTPIATSPFTVDVTNCNLDADLSYKDFSVIIDGVLNSNANWTKTSRTVLTYSGSTFASGFSSEVRRTSTSARVQENTYGTKISTAYIEAELNRLSRHFYEAVLNGVGPGSVVTSVVPDDTAYNYATWLADHIKPATRSATAAQLNLLATIASPALTGTPTAPTAADLTNTTQIATTAHTVTRVANALSGSPALGGTPTAPTAAKTVNTTQIATTAFGHLASVSKKITQLSTTTAYTATGTGAWVNAWTTGNITPRASTSSFLIIANPYMFYEGASHGRVRLVAGSTTLMESFLYSDDNILHNVPLMGVYTPASGSAFSIKIDMNPTANAGNFRFNDTNGSGSVTSMIEVIEFENTI